jgi:hypothetical protein
VKQTEEQRLAEEWLPGRVGPPWLLLVLEGILIAPAVIAHLIVRKPLPHQLVRTLGLLLLALLIVALIVSLVRFIGMVPKYSRGPFFLLDGGILWIINSPVFSTGYWELDGGGARIRHARPGQRQDFLFPQRSFNPPLRWKPGYIDYLFLAFCCSTAFSPADEAPLTQRAKLLVMAQATFSLVIAVMIISRATNIVSSR